MFLKNHKRRCFWRCSSKHEKIMQTKHLTRLIAHPYSQKLSVGSGGNSNWNVDYFFSKLQNLKLKADKTLKCPCEAVGLTAVSFSDNKRHMPSRMWPSTKWDRHSDTQTGQAKTLPCNCQMTSDQSWIGSVAAKQKYSCGHRGVCPLGKMGRWMPSGVRGASLTGGNFSTCQLLLLYPAS